MPDQRKDQDEQNPVSEASFATFVVSLGVSARIHLGTLPDPASQEIKPDRRMARQTIELLQVLKEKTQGNLTEAEATLLDDVLYELRLAYAQGAGTSSREGDPPEST